VIADDKEIESLAGIMGGDSTAVTLDTTDIYLEAAFWWPNAIQGRARRYNFSTDAAHRFERGVDYAHTVEHIERITSLIVEICGTGATKVGPVDDQAPNLPQRKPVVLRTARAAESHRRADHRRDGRRHLHPPAPAVHARAGLFHVTAPSYRFDIEIEEDLIEEVARVYGFENIPTLPPVAPGAMLIEPENTRSLFAIRHQLADLGYQEVVNMSFVESSGRDFAATWIRSACRTRSPAR
jgi:phenylalanyl-tRNA synthetase beta chain